jgi:EAL domain-containing protein (putative c-di-GMP-specific phosphodiesterase class I)
LKTLSSEGIKVALDDFGTGFASLLHLKQFPIDVLKIDRSFITELQLNPDDGAIVDAVIGLGNSLHMEVVAEGVETRAQHDFLEALGCDTGQGYLYSPAIPAAMVPKLVIGPIA